MLLCALVCSCVTPTPSRSSERKWKHGLQSTVPPKCTKKDTERRNRQPWPGVPRLFLFGLPQRLASLQSGSREETEFTADLAYSALAFGPIYICGQCGRYFDNVFVFISHLCVFFSVLLFYCQLLICGEGLTAASSRCLSR